MRKHPGQELVEDGKMLRAFDIWAYESHGDLLEALAYRNITDEPDWTDQERLIQILVDYLECRFSGWSEDEQETLMTEGKLRGGDLWKPYQKWLKKGHIGQKWTSEKLDDLADTLARDDIFNDELAAKPDEAGDASPPAPTASDDAAEAAGTTSTTSKKKKKKKKKVKRAKKGK